MSHDSHSEHHIVPVQVLTYTFVGLLSLTLITYLTSRVDFGVMNIPLALAIALTKVSLVVNYFMAVKYDKPIIKIIAYGMGLFVAIFMTFTLLDTNTRGTFQHNAAEFNQYKVKKADELNKIPERLTATEGGSLIVTAADSLTAKGSVTPADSTGAKADTTK